MTKQTEGDNRQRRARAKEARDEGRAPSEEGVTTGASKQRRHLGNETDRPDRLTGRGWGKQQPDKATGRPRPGTSSERDRGRPVPEGFPPRSENRGVRPGELTDEDERVLESLARLEGADDAPTVSEIAREAGLPQDEALPALQRLVSKHDVVQELPESDAGHRYRVKAR